MSFRCLSKKRLALLVSLAGGLVVSGCSLPEYRLSLANIPDETTHLSTALAIPQADGAAPLIPSERVESDWLDHKSPFRITVNLLDKYDHPPSAVFSAIARDAANCIVATGTTDPVSPSTTVADITLGLKQPTYPRAIQGRCASDGPLVLDILREEAGPFQLTNFRLIARGWDFQPTDQITVTSLVQIPSYVCRNSGCKGRCPEALDACADPTTKADTTCQTSCSVVVQPKFNGVGQWTIEVPEAGNSIEDPPASGALCCTLQSTNLTTMRGSPFRVTITRKGGTSSTYTEVDPRKKIQ